jgi:hypothetical protein
MPQAAATSVIIPSGAIIGAGVIACADTATDKAKPAIAINLIISLLPDLGDHPRMSGYRI